MKCSDQLAPRHIEQGRWQGSWPRGDSFVAREKHIELVIINLPASVLIVPKYDKFIRYLDDYRKLHDVTILGF